MAKYELTKEASEDLYRIWYYTVNTWSEHQADKYYSILIASFRIIAEKPKEIGKSYDVIYPGLKGERVGKHIVFFIPRNDKATLIVRVLHEKMDFKHHLNDKL